MSKNQREITNNVPTLKTDNVSHKIFIGGTVVCRNR